MANLFVRQVDDRALLWREETCSVQVSKARTHLCTHGKNESLELDSCNQLDSFSHGRAYNFTIDIIALILVIKKLTSAN